LLEALAAERLKLARHRAAWLLVWLYPIGITAIFVIVTVYRLAGGQTPQLPQVPETASSWIQETVFAWAGPPSTFGRYLVAAFAAVAFAGEYGWNTWKLIAPHQARWKLMAAKYLTVLGLLYAALALTGVLMVIYGWVGDLIGGKVTPQGITPGDLLREHGTAALVGLPAILLTVAYTSLAAVLTRSTIAAVIIGIVIATADEIFGKLAPALSVFAPDLVSVLFHTLPGYHLQNLSQWITEGSALRVPFPERGAVMLPWSTSLAVMAAWIGGLTALAVGLFQRQDIN
jgi:ABC-type transport system involved in multi-copper enzyme maturation permease subunit